jgi:hypothetical protein
VQLKQRSGEEYPFRLIVVRINENNGGVEEVTRQSIDPTFWTDERSVALAMSFSAAPPVTEEIEPGTYRIEVSAPDNLGPYLLVIGEDETWQGPFSRFISVFMTQAHFNVFPLFALLSPYVLIPLLALVATALWFKRRWDSVRI